MGNIKQVKRKIRPSNTFNAICNGLKPFGKLIDSEVSFYLSKKLN